MNTVGSTIVAENYHPPGHLAHSGHLRFSASGTIDGNPKWNGSVGLRNASMKQRQQHTRGIDLVAGARATSRSTEHTYCHTHFTITCSHMLHLSHVLHTTPHAPPRKLHLACSVTYASGCLAQSATQRQRATVSDAKAKSNSRRRKGREVRLHRILAASSRALPLVDRLSLNIPMASSADTHCCCASR